MRTQTHYVCAPLSHALWAHACPIIVYAGVHACRLKRTVARHFAPEATLYHPLTRAQNRTELYKVYRSYTYNFDSQPVFREIIIQVCM